MRLRSMTLISISVILLIVTSFSVSFAGTITYTYDDLNRLTKADYGNGSIITYTYDAAGNRLTMNAATPIVSPTPTHTVVPTPTPTPPPPCKAIKLDVKPKSLKLVRETSEQKTVTLTCKDGSPSVNQLVTVKILSGKKLVDVSPAEVNTDENGVATFTITATNKTGNAVVRFKHKKPNGGTLKGDVTVKVRKK